MRPRPSLPPAPLPATEALQQTHFLNPGEWGWAAAPAVMGTLLGSCVAITLWSRKRRLGAMCHFVLPDRRATPRHRDHELPDGRYGNGAFWLICRALRDQGIDPATCEARVFGGGRMFEVDAALGDVGSRNVEQALALLHAAQIPLGFQHTGQAGYRRLWFDLASGEVVVRFEAASV